MYIVVNTKNFCCEEVNTLEEALEYVKGESLDQWDHILIFSSLDGNHIIATPSI